LASELLDVATGKRREGVALQKVEDTYREKIGDDADVIAEVESITKMDTLVSVGPVIGSQS